jgi:hypothetical protein
MKPILLLCLTLSSCTVLSDPRTGKPVLFTTASADHFEYVGAAVALRVVNLKHERVGDLIGKAGVAGATLGLGVAP